MEAITPRLSQHLRLFREASYPVVGFGICMQDFDGIGWRESNDRGGRYLDLHSGSLLVRVLRDGREAQGWEFGLLVDGDLGGTLGWYPPKAVVNMPHGYFRVVYDLLASMKLSGTP